MTDRELVELAAKAAGVGPLDFDYAEREGHEFYFGPRLPMPQGVLMAAMWTYWNPLADDGDEARLEAACSLNVIWVPEGVTVRGTLPDGTHFGRLESFANHRDRHSARRRAGVRAAAAIGEKMP